ncbi:MAG: T9SS type A sorting domain-containing protein, partial [Saprospiraceae bacterium]|nr:T9SS type A sorting domain-containing protein [Saprospiraceae bacterium]
RLKNNTIQKINVSNSGLTTNDVTVYQKQDGTYIIQEQDPYLPFQMNTYTSCLINNFDTVKPMLMKGIPGIKWKFEDNNGNLWGTSRLSLHKLNDTILTTYTPDPAIYGNHLYLFDVCNDTINKKIWIGSDEGLLSFVNNSFSFESNFCNNVGSSVTAVFVDSNGGLWAGSNGRGVGIYKNGLWKSQNFTWTLYNDYIKNIVEDKNHALWFNNLDGDLGKLQNGVWTIYNSQNSPIYGYNLSPPVFDSQNNMYVMDQYTGIRILKNTVWDSIMIKTSNLESYSYGLMFDKNENLWISGNGITIYNPNGIVLSTDEPKTQTLKSKTVITYPNPANYGFNIILDEASKYPLQIMLYDIFGREVLTQSIQSERKVITNSISNGVYIIRLEDAKGKVFMNKLVIEH